MVHRRRQGGCGKHLQPRCKVCCHRQNLRLRTVDAAEQRDVRLECWRAMVRSY